MLASVARDLRARRKEEQLVDLIQPHSHIRRISANPKELFVSANPLGQATMARVRLDIDAIDGSAFGRVNCPHRPPRRAPKCKLFPLAEQRKYGESSELPGSVAFGNYVASVTTGVWTLALPSAHSRQQHENWPSR